MNLSIGGNGSIVIINSGVVIHDDTGNAVITGTNSTATNINNNGTCRTNSDFFLKIMVRIIKTWLNMV